MATKTDAAVAKARQQKIILIAGGVILAGLVALQGPKLLHRSSSSTSAAPAATSTTPATDGTVTVPTPTTAGTVTGTTTGGVTTPAVSTGGGQTAQVAGVVIRPAGAPTAGTGQLWSLSRFKVKDPFVQQVTIKAGSSAGATGTTTASPGGGATANGSTGVVATPSTATPVAYAYATLMVNGKPQQLTLKQVFPKAQPTFVLNAVDKHSIKIGVAGGKFAGGGTVKLELGKPVTLMNTTTGQRFVLKLVFTGAQPEQIAGFKQPGATAATTPAATTTPAVTTTASQP